jgi:hypothetical protein
MATLVDSKHQQLTIEEIVPIAIQEIGEDISPEQALAALAVEANEGTAIVMREGNTLFIIYGFPDNPSAAFFRVLNADILPNFINNIKMFLKAVGMGGITSLACSFPNEDLISIFSYIERNPPFEGMGYQLSRTDEGEIMAFINVGDVSKPVGGLGNVAPQQGAI